MIQLICLDRVLHLEPGHSGRALRHVPMTLDIFESHFPLFPVLPGVLILGTLAELAALVMRSETAPIWRLAGAERVRFRRYVRPGDQMVLSVAMRSASPEAALLRGEVRVDEEICVTAGTLRLVPRGLGAGAPAGGTAGLRLETGIA